MKKTRVFYCIAILIICILLSCKKEELKTAPVVSISSPSGATSTSATSGGNVSADGGATVTGRGVCWSTGSNPTVADSKTSDGSGTGSFTSSITGLNPGSTYTVKAYAINSVGTSYSSSATFSTTAIGATLTTIAATSITSTTASSGGSITSDGGSAVTARGVCWATTTGPAISGSKSSDGTGIGNFISSISGLTQGTTYYVRAYATNGTGTTYGNEVTFTNPITTPTLTTQAISSITTNSASCGGSITSAGGGTISARGVCWGTSSGPTINNSKTSDGTGIGSFVSSMTGLTVATTYYVRAYATNGAGTSYGNEITFTTYANPPTLVTTTMTSVTHNTATSGGTISADGGAAVTARGVCWNTSTAPTINNSKTIDGTGIGGFPSSLTGLVGSTTYYLRAYATNSAGTAYGNEVTFTTAVPPPTVTDIDGNVYNIITIGPQEWIKENLRTTKLNDGTAIPFVTGNTTWGNLISPGYCWYNNDQATFKNTYGGLYNFYSVETTKLCPIGWHVPTNDDWNTLITYLGGSTQATIKLKETGTTHWATNSNATNSSGFTALPGGFRDSYYVYLGEFRYIGYLAEFWSSTVTTINGKEMNYVEINNNSNSTRLLSTFYDYSFGQNYRSLGYSVRCIKN